MMSRANPFGDLDDFATPSQPRPVPGEALDKLAEANGFPSRKARSAAPAGKGDTSVRAGEGPSEGRAAPAAPPRQQRRHVTGRNRQINIKATEETITALYTLADDMGVPLGAVLEQALAALAKKQGKGVA
jgi:hypothetical protein